MKVEDGPSILQCDGEKVVSVLSDSTRAERETFRVNGKTRTFEVWNPDKSQFSKWGDGTLHVDANTISYVASLVSDGVAANRQLRIDRHDGTIVDDITVNIGGSTHFSGRCEPVDEPNAAEQKF